jgi:hypothetical protein
VIVVANSGPLMVLGKLGLLEVLPDRVYAMGKMDIEGAEPLAPQGAEWMLKVANPPVWPLEMNGLLRDFG